MAYSVPLAAPFVAAALLLHTACLAKHPASSSVRHDMGRPTSESGAWQWREVSDDDYFTLVAASAGDAASAEQSRASYLPADHPAVQRLAYWQDRIDAHLRQTYPAELAAVPKPKVKIINSTEVNAYVAPLAICYDNVTVILGQGKASPSATESVVWSGNIFLSSAASAFSTLKCSHEVATKADLTARLARHAAQSGADSSYPEIQIRLVKSTHFCQKTCQ